MTVEILAHRGIWRKPEEANSPVAIERAFAMGVGVETDLQSHGAEIFLSHDPVRNPESAFRWRDFVSLWDRFPNQPVFLNIKQDGLLPLLAPYLRDWGSRTVVCFDMSLPELFRYSRELPSSQLATRISEWERAPLVERCDWLWCDGFESDPDLANPVLAENRNKRLVFVSPELHGRDEGVFWKKIRAFESQWPTPIRLCTDRTAWGTAT